MADCLLDEFNKLKGKTWKAWSDFEKDLTQFEESTWTAHRIDRSDLVSRVRTAQQPRICTRPVVPFGLSKKFKSPNVAPIRLSRSLAMHE